MKKVLIIEGLKCGHCSSRLEKVLNNVEGIKASVVLEEKKAYLELSKEFTDEELSEIVDDAGFEVVGIE